MNRLANARVQTAVRRALIAGLTIWVQCLVFLGVAALPGSSALGISCQTCEYCSAEDALELVRCDGKTLGVGVCQPSHAYPSADMCEDFCAVANTIAHNECVGHGQMKWSPDYPGCQGLADCNGAGDCDNPATATVDPDQIEPTDADEVCGDEKDNACTTAPDRCGQRKKQPVAGDTNGWTCQERQEGKRVAGADPILLDSKAASTDPFTDFSIEAVVKLGIARTYTSADKTVRGGGAARRDFGKGWYHDWDASLTCENASTCRVSLGISGVFTFTWNRTASGLGAYAGETWDIYDPTANREVFGLETGKLVRRPTGEFILFRGDGREFHFQSDCARDYCGSTDNGCTDPLQKGRAQLSRVVDDSGRSIEVGHDRPSGLFLSLTDELGHTLELRGTLNACGRTVESLVYDGVPYVRYVYSGGNLVTVRQWTSNGTGGVIRSYEYGTNGYLLRVRNEGGDPIVEFGYDANRRASQVTDAASTVSVSYDSSRQTTITSESSGGSSSEVIDTGKLSFLDQCYLAGGGPVEETIQGCWDRRLRNLLIRNMCGRDSRGNEELFEPDGLGRVVHHAIYAPGIPCAVTLESLPLRLDLNSSPGTPLLEEWFEYGRTREIAEGVFVYLDTVTRVSRRSIVAGQSGSNEPPPLASVFHDYDPSPKPGDPSGYQCSEDGETVRGVRCRTVETGYTLDAGGNIVLEEHTTYFTYDAKGRLVRAVGPVLTSGTPSAGTIVPVEERSYWPDLGSQADLPRLGRLREVRRYPGSSRPALVTSYDYDAFGPYEITDPNGRTTLLVKDARGRILAVATPDGRAVSLRYYDGNLPRTIALPSGATRRLSYDQRGRLRLVEALTTDPEATNPSTPAGVPTVVRWSESYAYDPAGNVVLVERRDAVGTVRFRQAREYDAEHKPLRQLHPEHPDRSASWAYDAFGDLTGLTDEESRSVELVLDPMGRPSIARRKGFTPGGSPVSLDVAAYVYDGEQPSLQTVTDGEGRTTRYVHDDFDRLLSVESPATLTSGARYQYDAGGNVLSRSWAGSTVAYAYDGLGRLTHLEGTSSSGAPPVSYTFRYDETAGDLGRLTSIAAADRTTVYLYDEVGRLRFETVTVMGASTPLVTEYRYDPDGVLDTIVHATGLAVRYEIDPATGRPVAVRNLQTGSSFASGISYFPSGPVRALTFGNGLTQSSAFNLRYEPVSLTSGPLTLGYTPTPAGDIGALSSGTDLDIFTYDFADRLIARKSTTGVRPESFSFVYAGGRIVQALDPSTGRPRFAYGYDDHSNLSAISRYDAAGAAIVSTVCLVHDALGRLVLVGSAAPGAGGPDSRACRSAAEVVQVEARFTYDAYNRRVARQSADGTSTEFVFGGGGDLLCELTRQGQGWAPLRDYVSLEGKPLAQVEYPGPAGGAQGHVYFVHTDHLGTPRALTNGDAQTVWTGTVLPYGEALEATTTDPASGRVVVTNLRLPGQYDERLFGSLGLQGPYYNWNRWYLPGVGRYLEPDPIALAGGFNGEFGPDWYGYANQNPLSYVDPDGRYWAPPLPPPTWPLIPAGLGGAGLGYLGRQLFPGIDRGMQRFFDWTLGAPGDPRNPWYAGPRPPGFPGTPAEPYDKRTRGNQDPVWKDVYQPFNPGRGGDGRCIPCPPSSPEWEHQNHNKCEGTHNHYMYWDQKPDCTCVPKRYDPARGR